MNRKLNFFPEWGDRPVTDKLTITLDYEDLSLGDRGLIGWKNLVWWQRGIILPLAKRLTEMWPRIMKVESRRSENWTYFHSLNCTNKVLPDFWFIPDSGMPYMHVMTFKHSGPFVNYIYDSYNNIPITQFSLCILDFLASVHNYVSRYRRHEYKNFLYSIDNILKSSVKNYSIYYR